MARLPQIQGDFQSYMLGGEAAAIESHVIGTDKVPIATRLAIYSDGYTARLVEALEASFPVLSQLLGEEDFRKLGTDYVRSHDSPFRNVRYYGDEFAEFLASNPVLAELARWEWALTEVFDASDVTPLGIEAFAQVAPQQWDQLRFDFHPAMRRMALAWNVPQIWKAVSEEGEPPEMQLNDAPVEWVLWRQDLSNYFRSLKPGEAVALEAARGGQPFGEICALLADAFGEAGAPAKAAGFLRDWVESGLIIAIR